jgi:transposase
MKKAKVSFQVKKIVEESNKKGQKLLKVFITSRGKEYTKVVRKIDYLNESARIGLHRLWIKGIKEQMIEDDKNEGEIKKDAKVLADITGIEIEDEEE